ncbi:hypothetical protein GCM10028796_31470 [Ramlibacter monticola]|uniref:Uncharacterized protein n=1 Tax=Ramlibacter monticola TaxID=1926872 RepID=A0A936Z3D2_9BURK|nr:hypothetical protein [Ramlibacter monticola]MBL0394280.1 hypothetical protein [Ramlibacter monticola]
MDAQEFMSLYEHELPPDQRKAAKRFAMDMPNRYQLDGDRLYGFDGSVVEFHPNDRKGARVLVGARRDALDRLEHLGYRTTQVLLRPKYLVTFCAVLGVPGLYFNFSGNGVGLIPITCCFLVWLLLRVSLWVAARRRNSARRLFTSRGRKEPQLAKQRQPAAARNYRNWRVGFALVAALATYLVLGIGTDWLHDWLFLEYTSIQDGVEVCAGSGWDRECDTEDGVRAYTSHAVAFLGNTVALITTVSRAAAGYWVYRLISPRE